MGRYRGDTMHLSSEAQFHKPLSVGSGRFNHALPNPNLSNAPSRRQGASEERGQPPFNNGGKCDARGHR